MNVIWVDRETVLEHSLTERERETTKGRREEKGVGKLALGIVNKVKVRTLAFSKKLGLILFLPGASQNEQPCSFLLSAWNRKLREINPRTYD